MSVEPAGENPILSVAADVVRDISATLSADGKRLTIFAVNDAPDEIVRPLDVSAFFSEPQDVSVWTLADQQRAGEPDAPTASPNLSALP